MNASTPKTPTRTGMIECFDGINTIKADPGATITWDAGERGRIVSIWVPDDRVFGRRIVADQVQLPFRADVLSNVPAGTPKEPLVYEYAIYDHGTGHFVVGRSHPKIEIPEP
jgi:hypothetical protein